MIFSKRFSLVIKTFIAVFIFVILISFIPITKVFSYSEQQADTIFQATIYPVPIPDSLTFAGEAVPLEFFDVRESLDRELQVNTFWHSQTLLLLKRANRYFPIIEPILEANNIPIDFKYLAVAESGLTQAISPSKAVGFWQILEGTGEELGLEINNEVDERYHIEKSTQAACQYFKKAYEKYGNWTMVAASYNFGMNGIDKQILRQENDSYYNMVLGEETGRYIFRILALKVIFENPTQYGFILNKCDLYPPLEYYEVEVDSTITNISAFARHFKTNYKILKFFNPWLRESYLTNKLNKTYRIKIPKEGFRETVYKK
ncbi:lytic transglycosylase domain-containing protein [Tenuifilum thalassicum]|uniref:Lytic transglycosylase domain-containing protein n=1 Tax=Tenuifilum thalassicum TaxID=2590900 RepID=A0A7D4BAD1_9BACT|nr:lytic transglycosylase domain-containing protein [Tenuifilum thalassicum]QKG79340.1 lytic transglycosylase domain-containing protein [Tenuifilum thalassicum]